MKPIKTTICVLTAALTFALVGSRFLKDRQEYVFQGDIEGEQVTFSSTVYDSKSIPYNHIPYRRFQKNILEVVKDDKEITYHDFYWNNLEIESVSIEHKWYNADDEFGEKILEEAQKQFEGYLAKIKEVKQQKALETMERELKKIR